MAEMKIDYSAVIHPEIIPGSAWRPPRHVYFGPRDSNTGQMSEEPTYAHQEYPKTLYKLDGDVIRARIVADTTEHSRIGPGWEQTPAAFGMFTAPSHEQMIQMQAQARLADEDEVPAKRGPGRPRKDE